MPGYNDNSEFRGGAYKIHTISGLTISPVLITTSPPTIGTVTTLTTEYTAVIPFTAPTVDPNYPIISYTAVSNQGGFSNTISQSGSGTISITGLTAGANYQFVVYANNGYVESVNSNPSNAVQAIKVPGAPTGVTATTTGLTTANISYTAPADNGGTTITSYTAVSSPDNISATVSTSASGNISITGLTAATAYTFNVYATNLVGNSPNATTATMWTETTSSQTLFTTVGTTSWIVPNGVTSISAVAIGGGGGGGANKNLGSGTGGAGAGLSFVNSRPVTPGETLTIFVGSGGVGPGGNGGNSTITRVSNSEVILLGSRGLGANTSGFPPEGGAGGWGLTNANVIRWGGSDGGTGGYANGVNTGDRFGGGGGGGTGGYGNTVFGGGDGGSYQAGTTTGFGNAPFSEAGGAGGGGSSGAGFNGFIPGFGGGVSVFGQGAQGSGGTKSSTQSTANGKPGSSGTQGLYGGGGPGADPTRGAAGSGVQGVVRIIWGNSAVTRAFPSTNTANL